MSTQGKLPILLTGIALALVQIIDIMLHVATNQAEPVRITANFVVLVWLAFAAFGKFKQQGFRMLAVGFMAVYLALNVAFLAVNGPTNPVQGGTLRIALLVFIVLSLVLAALLTYFGERR